MREKSIKPIEMNANNLLAICCLTLVLALQVNQAAAFQPIVKTGVSELSPDGQHVEVHLPAVFNMVLDTRGRNNEGYRLSETVLAGLVQIDIDRVRDAATGRKSGPIAVRVMGLTMYDNKAAPVTPADEAAAVL